MEECVNIGFDKMTKLELGSSLILVEEWSVYLMHSEDGIVYVD
jgi:hypothetical protein